MIVIGNKPGQLGNRLVQSAHILSFAAEQGIGVWNLAFDEYAAEFEGPRRDLLCRFPGRRSAVPGAQPLRSLLFWFAYRTASVVARIAPLQRLIRIVRIDWDEDLELRSETFRRRVKGVRPCILQGWHFRDVASLDARADEIRAYYTPTASHRIRAEQLSTQVRQDDRLVVGVHARHGDYREFRDGAYFYDAQQYLALMERVAALMHPRSVVFVVCSDDAGTVRQLVKHEHVWPGPGEPIDDILALASCDMIFGPPSTFSAWASFYGEVPLWWVRRAGDQPQWSDFQVERELVERP